MNVKIHSALTGLKQHDNIYYTLLWAKQFIYRRINNRSTRKIKGKAFFCHFPPVLVNSQTCQVSRSRPGISRIPAGRCSYFVKLDLGPWFIRCQRRTGPQLIELLSRIKTKSMVQNASPVYPFLNSITTKQCCRRFVFVFFWFMAKNNVKCAII